MATKAELAEQLEELGIEYDLTAPKAVLEAMLAHPSTPTQTGERPVWEGGENKAAYHARLRDWKIEQRR
tara:strand:- start:752 stop:958 length:207 start_codon:yes stop_codon:yes gene_type:complete